MKKVFVVLTLLAANAPIIAYASARVDVRGVPAIATGVEYIGSADGADTTVWNTLDEHDGWTTLTSGEETVDVLVLNVPSVVGGRMSVNETWDDERVVVVRDDVVVPSGRTLTLSTGCVVKFTEGARIVVENGGAVVAEGAYLAAFDDDSVGGDTDMNGNVADGDRDGAQLSRWWLEDQAVAELSTVRFVDGATNLPVRTYTAGCVLGALPELTREDARFGGWFTESGGGGAVVTSDGVVASGETVLYAHWIPYELSIDSASASVGCLATNGAFMVTANSAWEISCDVDWVTVQGGRAAYPYSAAAVYTVAENANADARTATIRVTMRRYAGDSAPCKCDFTIEQAGMAQLAAPTINPADGTTFIGSSRRVSISGAESDAEIRYTLDGSDPTATSKLYTKSFNVFDTTDIKARAFRNGSLPSETVSSRVVRLQTLAEALDVPLWTVTTSGDAEWTVESNMGRDASSCVRSGMIGNNQKSELNTTVDGAGALTFWWHVDCEDDPDSDNWDFLRFEVDGVEIVRIDGDSGWRQVSVKIKSEGAHTLKWTYSKDDIDEYMTGIEDCGRVDQLVWKPIVGDNEVPLAWLENIGIISAGMTAEEAAGLDPDGDGLTTAQEYIAGTDPTDPDSKFAASIEIVDGQPVVTYTPDLLSERKYIKLGKVNLSDPNEDWVEVKDGEEGNYNFFRVTVDMP